MNCPNCGGLGVIWTVPDTRPSVAVTCATCAGLGTIRGGGRCTAVHPMHDRQVRCEEPRGHAGEHFHSLYMRSWE